MKEWEGLSPEHRQLIEELSNVEHIQWMSWAAAIEKYVPKEIAERWKKNWKPYNQLSEDEKDKDRRWAMCIYSVLQKGLPKCRFCGHDPSDI